MIEFESSVGSKMRIQWKGIDCTRLDKPAACLAGIGAMIQITAQMRVLVAIEPVDGRKGLILWCGFARKSSLRIHSPAVCSFSEPQRNVDSAAQL